MHFTGDAKLATFAYELGAQAASQVKLVGWLPGDEFDVVRKGKPALGAKGTSTAAEGELSRVTFHKLSERIPSLFHRGVGGLFCFFCCSACRACAFLRTSVCCSGVNTSSNCPISRRWYPSSIACFASGVIFSSFLTASICCL